MIELKSFEITWMDFSRSTLRMNIARGMAKHLKEFVGKPNSNALREKLIEVTMARLKEFSSMGTMYDDVFDLKDEEVQQLSYVGNPASSPETINFILGRSVLED